MIAIGSDHAGFKIKESIKDFFQREGIDYKDFGTNSTESVDYPEFARKVSESVVEFESEKGILVCGTGIGVCIAANKIKGIRAALCHNVNYARMARKHNDANVLCLGGRENTEEESIEIVKAFLATDFEGGRHSNRLSQITKLEEKLV